MAVEEKQQTKAPYTDAIARTSSVITRYEIEIARLRHLLAVRSIEIEQLRYILEQTPTHPLPAIPCDTSSDRQSDSEDITTLRQTKHDQSPSPLYLKKAVPLNDRNHATLRPRSCVATSRENVDAKIRDTNRSFPFLASDDFGSHLYMPDPDTTCDAEDRAVQICVGVSDSNRRPASSRGRNSIVGGETTPRSIDSLTETRLMPVDNLGITRSNSDLPFRSSSMLELNRRLCPEHSERHCDVASDASEDPIADVALDANLPPTADQVDDGIPSLTHTDDPIPSRASLRSTLMLGWPIVHEEVTYDGAVQRTPLPTATLPEVSNEESLYSNRDAPVTMESIREGIRSLKSSIQKWTLSTLGNTSDPMTTTHSGSGRSGLCVMVDRSQKSKQTILLEQREGVIDQRDKENIATGS